MRYFPACGVSRPSFLQSHPSVMNLLPNFTLANTNNRLPVYLPLPQSILLFVTILNSSKCQFLYNYPVLNLKSPSAKCSSLDGRSGAQALSLLTNWQLKGPWSRYSTMLWLLLKSSRELMLHLGEVICRPYILPRKSWWQLKRPGVWCSTALSLS